VRARGVPVGLGEPLFDKLDADIAYAMMGLNAVKGVTIGDGFGVVPQRGTVHGDELTPEGFASNHAGGVLGGISTGQDLVVSLAIKPTSSIRTPKASIDRAGQPTQVQTFGRHDPCVGIRATPIAEALLALVVMDHALRHRAQCGDVVLPMRPSPGPSPRPSLEPARPPRVSGLRRFGALSFAYFAAIGLFNPYAPLWFQSLGLSTLVIGGIARCRAGRASWRPTPGAGRRPRRPAHRTDPPGRAGLRCWRRWACWGCAARCRWRW
jgi:hypothetical protein